MKRILILSLAIFATACGAAGLGGGPGGKLTATFIESKGAPQQTKDLTVKQGTMPPSMVPHTAKGERNDILHYEFELSNFDIDDKDFKTKQVTQDGQMFAKIILYGPKGATDTTALAPGTFEAAQHEDGVNVNGKVGTADFDFFDGGKKGSSSVSTVSARRGQVRITSVAADLASGEIDMSDDYRAIKGSFTAKILPKR